VLTRTLLTVLLFGSCLGVAQAQSSKVFLNNKPFTGRISGSPSDVMVQADTAMKLLGLNVTIAPEAPSIELEGDKISLTWLGDIPMLRAKDLAQHFGGKYDYNASLGAVDIYAYDPVAAARKSLVAVFRQSKVTSDSDFNVLVTLTKQILVRDLGLKLDTPAQVLFSTPAEIAKAGGGQDGTFVSFTREARGEGTAGYKFMVRQGLRPATTVNGLAWAWGVTWANQQGAARDMSYNQGFAYWVAFKTLQLLSGPDLTAALYRRKITNPALQDAFDGFADTDRMGGPEAVLQSVHQHVRP
jgi:hypothetical protein